MILFVCSQGRNRSRTAEVLALLGGADARSCGTDPDAIAPLNPNLLWAADRVVCMEQQHADIVREYLAAEGKAIVSLGIDDIWEPFEHGLIKELVSLARFRLEDYALANVLEAGARQFSLKKGGIIGKTKMALHPVARCI